MKIQEFTTLAGTFVVLGIIFGSDRLIGYSFIETGTILAIIGVIKIKKQTRKKEIN